MLLLALAIPALAAGADARAWLVRARQLYNQRHFAEAIAAADRARLTPGLADAADLVAARAYLERYRASAAEDDLEAARARLRRADPLRFTPGERAEFIVGLGETLYFEDAFGAAAEMLGPALDDGVDLPPEARERVVDWWASALDREARARPDAGRAAVYARIRARMREEVASHPGSGAAAYWLAVASLGDGDPSGAWSAAQAGWARATLASDHGAALRADLDRFVLTALVPVRARALDVAPDTVRDGWERFKTGWTK